MGAAPRRGAAPTYVPSSTALGITDVVRNSPTYRTAKYGETDLLHATAIRDPETGAVTIFAVNRSQDEELPLEVALDGFEPAKIAEHQVLADSDPDARNTLTDPDHVTPHQAQDTTLDGAVLRATLEPMSWNMIHLT